MVESAMRGVILPAVSSIGEWITTILDSIDGSAFYIACVFITLTCGFLLANFRVAMYVGSDHAKNTAISIKAAREEYKRRQGKLSTHVKSRNK